MRAHRLFSEAASRFDDSLRPSLPTIAEPSWFAPPIDVQEDEDALTLLFAVSEEDRAELRVEPSGKSLFLWGRHLWRRGKEQAGRRAMRVFALPFDVGRRAVCTEWSGQVLRVRLAKKKAAAVRSDPVSSAA